MFGHRKVESERAGLRRHRPADQVHAGLLRRAVALLRVAPDARRDEVRPRLLAAPGLGKYVVEVQLLARQAPAAELAGEIIALEDRRGIQIRDMERDAPKMLAYQYCRCPHPAVGGGNKVILVSIFITYWQHDPVFPQFGDCREQHVILHNNIEG